MATARRGGGSPGSWRGLDQLDRFLSLLNHFGTADALADASGISARSLRAVFQSAVLDGKTSKALESDAYYEGFRRARHRMTDHMRRIVQKSSSGKYEAPIIRTPTTVIEPRRFQAVVTQKDYGGNIRQVLVKSSWQSYRVEFLSDSQIHSLLMELFGLFMDTGQFNVMRYEYLADADVYSGGKFKDDDLEDARERNEVIKLSTGQFPFVEYYRPDRFADAIMADWYERRIIGGIRMTELFFSSMDDIEKKMPLARADYRRYKARKQRGTLDNRSKGRKRGI